MTLPTEEELQTVVFDLLDETCFNPVLSTDVDDANPVKSLKSNVLEVSMVDVVSDEPLGTTLVVKPSLRTAFSVPSSAFAFGMQIQRGSSVIYDLRCYIPLGKWLTS